jgi:broad specificity phosphatase PhoE
MLFIYIRHGEPIYSPDSLTGLGKQQAEAVAKRLALIGVDKIYASTSNRAIQTALPTAKMFNKKITYLDFANESHTWNNLTVDKPSGRYWLFQLPEMINLFHTPEIMNLGNNWYEHPVFADKSYKEEMNRIQTESNLFFSSLGYQYVGNGRYKVSKENDDHIALFAHQGFGFAFLSLLLDIPYPYFCTRFELGHAKVIMIDFKNVDGYSYPKVISMVDGY